jgi:serine/threonine-protein kinase
LFNEARGLIGQGKFDQACPKLEAASKLYAGSGVLLNLGDCYEHLGRTASAWNEFGEAVSAAERAGRADDQAEAKRRQAALDPKLSKIVIHVAKASPGLVVKRDGTALDPAVWGIAIPVDPGAHTVTAEAVGRAPWSTSVNVVDPGKTVTVEVPDSSQSSAVPLVVAPAVVLPAPLPTSGGVDVPANAGVVAETSSVGSTSYWTGRRVAGVVVAGVGVVSLGVGGILGLAAKSKFNSAENEASPERESDSASAVSLGNVATSFVIGGAVVAAAGLVVWLTASSAPVQVGTNGGQVLVRGSF